MVFRREVAENEDHTRAEIRPDGNTNNFNTTSTANADIVRLQPVVAIVGFDAEETEVPVTLSPAELEAERLAKDKAIWNSEWSSCRVFDAEMLMRDPEPNFDGVWSGEIYAQPFWELLEAASPVDLYLPSDISYNASLEDNVQRTVIKDDSAAKSDIKIDGELITP